jgi:hypothetical protein
MTRPRWRTAVHEAGHAVATVALGGTLTQVSVRRIGHTGGRCWSDTHDLPPLSQAIVSFAGPCAELFIAEQPDDRHRLAAIDSGDPCNHVGADWPTAHALAERHGFSIDDATDQTALLVLDHWPAIQAVARALRGSRRGIVSGTKVAEILTSTDARRVGARSGVAARARGMA